MRHVQLIAQSLLLAGSIAFGATSLLAKPVTATTVPSEEKPVTFTVRTKMGFLKVEGWSKGPDANPTGTFKISGPKAIEGEATFKLTSLTTDMTTRDEHMAEDMKLANSKDGKLILTSLPWEDPSSILSKETDKQAFEGKLTLNKIEKPISGTVSTKSLGGDKVRFEFKFEVSLSAYSMERRKHLGVQVEDLVPVTIVTLAKVVAQ